MLGTDGLAVQTWIQTNTAPADAADIAAIIWPWSEDDSRVSTAKNDLRGGRAALPGVERGMLSRSAPSLPQVWWSAIPFDYGSNDAGTQMQREVVADMAADPTQNVTVVLPQTADSLPRSSTRDRPTTGLWTGGDSLHRDVPDNQRFGMLAAPLVARAVLAAGGGDTLSAIPAGIPPAGGPVVTHVYRQSSTSLIVTVQHDCGTDLIVPATQAASGIGWAVMDGGSVGVTRDDRHGDRVRAVERDAVAGHAGAGVGQRQRGIAACSTRTAPATIGRGNAVTDNLSLVTPPAGWNIAADLGSGWSLEHAGACADVDGFRRGAERYAIAGRGADHPARGEIHAAKVCVRGGRP